MKVICGIVIDGDKTFVSFVRFKGIKLTFFEEIEIPVSCYDNDVIAYLRKNSEVLNEKITAVEKEHSFLVEEIFIQLPLNLAGEKKVKDIIPLKKEKQITSRDISSAKKYLEDKFLDWDDFCLHNIIMDYEVDGTSYDRPPLKILAKKVKVQALLIWVKDNLYKDAADILDNCGRNFAGFIAPQLGTFFSVFTEKGKAQVVVNINYDECYSVINSGGDFTVDREPGLSLKRIIQKLAERFIIPFPLAEEVFYRYISFNEASYSKEVTIKKEDGYLNLSAKTLNSFIKDYVKGAIISLLQRISKNTNNDKFIVSFIGRLNKKEGFGSFLKSVSPYSLQVPIQKSVISSSFGCLRCGLFRFFENDHKKNESRLKQIFNIYKEYF